MTLLSSIYKHTLGRVFPSSATLKPSAGISKKRKVGDDNEDDNEAISRRRKREDSEEHKDVITKRRRVDADHFAPIVDGQTYESTAIEAPPLNEQTCGNVAGTVRIADRFLMPPPLLNATKNRSRRKMDEDVSRRTSLDFEGASQLSLGTKATQQRTSDEFINDYDMERARRHAAATTLPANSGVWERGEKELFYHLSYRGFEPLFPMNWMNDFPTMPLSLYQSEDDDQPPLIEVLRKRGEFRAIRELRELLDLGKDVRDKVLSSPGVKRQTIIEKAIKKYISWALGDAGLRLPSSLASSKTQPLPIHVVVKQKARQTTTDCILEMKTKLHALRTRHCQARNIHASVERDQASYETPNSEGEETWIADSSDDDLPVLYGIVICRSLLAIFTLNSRTPAPKVSLQGRFREDDRLSPAASESVHGNIEDGHDAIVEDDSASDPRFISDFDFSDPAKDVWNALVIAIVAMQIRRDMLLLAGNGKAEDSLEDIRAGIEDASVMDVDEDDPDA